MLLSSFQTLEDKKRGVMIQCLVDQRGVGVLY
jgi:hypothetical protein